MFWVRWLNSLFERMILKRKNDVFSCLFFVELAISQRWSAIFYAKGAWGGKPIGRVRVNLIFLGMMKSVISQIYANPELQIQSMQQSKEPYDAKIIFETSDWTKIQTFDIDIKKESLVWMAENSTKIYLRNGSKLKVLKKNFSIFVF